MQHIVYRDKTTTKVLQENIKKEVDRYTRLLSVTDKILEKIEAQVDAIDPNDKYNSLKQLTGALKDIKDIQSLKGDADTREQEARIKKLEKEATLEDKDKEPIRVVLEGNTDRYAD